MQLVIFNFKFAARFYEEINEIMCVLDLKDIDNDFLWVTLNESLTRMFVYKKTPQGPGKFNRREYQRLWAAASKAKSYFRFKPWAKNNQQTLIKRPLETYWR